MNGPIISRRGLLGGLAAGSALSLVGCSSTTANAPTVSSDGVVGSTELTVYAWSNGPLIDENFNKSVEQFNKEFSGRFKAKINFLPYDQYWQKIQLQYASNQPFDMYYWDVQAFAHYQAGLLANCDDAVKRAGLDDSAKYPTALFDPWRFDGKSLFAIPENIQSTAFFYNKTHFDQAGLAHPDSTWTWEKVVETAPKLMKKEGDKVTRWGMDIGALGVWWGAQALSWAAGTAFFDKPNLPTSFKLADKENTEIFRFIQDLMWDKHIAPRPDERTAAGEAGGFAGGLISMTSDGTWSIAGLKDMKDEWGMTTLPLWKGKSITPYFLGGWVIPAGSKALTAAQTFATWRATTFQAQMAKDHDWIPIQTAARESSDMLGGMPKGFSEAMSGITSARIGDLYHANGQQMVNEVLLPKWDQLLRNQLTPEAAAKELQEAMTKLL